MKFSATAIADVLLIEPRVLGDARGFFFESFSQKAFDEAVGNEVRFVQDNHSRSTRGVLRGLHYQLEPQTQGKLVRVTRGAVFDVAVDLRPQSPTYRQWAGFELDDVEHRQLWLPPGLAHGFFVLSETADFVYKTTAYYAPALERALRWDDPALAIDWPLEGATPAVSAKDAAAPLLDWV